MNEDEPPGFAPVIVVLVALVAWAALAVYAIAGERERLEAEIMLRLAPVEAIACASVGFPGVDAPEDALLAWWRTVSETCLAADGKGPYMQPASRG
jgi:hypothetical protein